MCYFISLVFFSIRNFTSRFINSLAFQNAFAAYQRRLFTPYIPNYAYSYANANNMGYYSTLGDLYGSDIDNR